MSPEREMEHSGDIFIPAHQLAEAMNGDRVVVRIEKLKDDGRVEGRVIRVLERANSSLVGRYDQAAHGIGIVVPFDRRVLMDIFIPSGQERGAEPGQMVVVELTRWPTGNSGAIGRVREVLGDIDAPGVDTEIIIRKFGIPDAHSEESVTEAIRLGGAVKEADIRARTDFRALPTVTIDGEHARDFDDAITIEKLANGNYWLGVHIADVSHYVQEGSCARSRSVPARHVGLLSRAGGPHVSVGTVDRALQPQSACRPPGADLLHGGRPAAAKSSVQSSMTG